MEKIVLIGAGSASFTRGLVADLISTGLDIDLALVDIDAVALEVAERLVKKMVALRGAPIRVQACLDRKQALPGATCVICTVGVGGRRAWEQDVFIPRKYGIFVPVGDTVGPGGSSRALRMIPAMVAIAEDVLDLAPDALFINYGNPMAAVCRGIRKASAARGKEARVIGLCHGVFDTAKYLARALNVPFGQMHYTAVGINHLTWFTSVKIFDSNTNTWRDALPEMQAASAVRLRVAAPAAHPEGAGAGWVQVKSPYSNGVDPFSWQLVRDFDALPAPLDRHVTEFFPQFFRDGAYYGLRLGVDVFSFEGTIADGDRGFEQMKADAFRSGPLDPAYLDHAGGEHEQAVDILLSIRGGKGKVFSANLPNTGQVPNLPADSIVESPAVADADGMHPLIQPPLPQALAGVLATRFQWVETIVEAALEKSRKKFIQALVLDGYVNSVEQAGLLADELLVAQAEYLAW